jgi:hypothetical protein
MHREWWLTREAAVAAFCAIAILGFHAALNERPLVALLSGSAMAADSWWGGDLRES